MMLSLSAKLSASFGSAPVYSEGTLAAVTGLVYLAAYHTADPLHLGQVQRRCLPTAPSGAQDRRMGCLPWSTQGRDGPPWSPTDWRGLMHRMPPLVPRDAPKAL